MSKAAHFVWLNPGEKLYVISDAVGRNHDHTHVTEISFDGNGDANFPMHADPMIPRVDRRHTLEANAVANITYGGDETIPVDAALAELSTEGTDFTPFVSVPLEMVRRHFPKHKGEQTKAAMRALGVEEAR